MKKMLLLFAFSVLVTNRYYAQESFTQLPSLTWHFKLESYHPVIFFSDNIRMFNAQTVLNGNQKPFMFSLAPFHYEAFFCRLEEKNRNRLGFFFKVHAGDYDRYMNRNK